VTPFLGDDSDSAHAVKGAFGPAKDTTIVVTFNSMGAGSFSGFALVPDAKAKHGHRKLALPKLPAGSMDGDMKTGLVANLDKDADDELVLGFHVQRGVSSPHGGHTYGTYEYVVLDWDGKKFVRVAALEKKISTRMTAPGREATELGEDELRATLGVAKKK
jgi:hypothetical protein